MTYAVETSESNIEGRVDELIERGLALYGGGDLDGAMSAWRHALALDDENRRAADDVAYVKRHFEFVDEEVLEAGNFAPPDVELEIPFGLVTVGLQKTDVLDIYESFEVSGTPAEPDASDFEEEVPTRVGATAPIVIDEGWSLEGDEETSGGVLNPLVRTSRATGEQDVSDAVRLEAERLELEGAIAGVSAELAEIDLPPPESFTIEAEEPDPKQTVHGFPDPPKPSEPVESQARATAEISPVELGEALKALELGGSGLGELGLAETTSDGGGLSAASRAESLSDVEFDLGEPEPRSDFQAKPYASVAVVGEDLEAIGDADISFRPAGDAGLIEVEPTGGELELQLAELEKELKTGARSVEWTKHEGAGSQASATQSVPLITPLAPRLPRTEPAERPGQTTRPPTAGLESVQTAILDVVERTAIAGESSDERLRRRISGFLACAESELEREEFASAAVAADMALEESPASALGQKLVHERSDLLVTVFRKFLGDPSGVVAVALPLHELSKHQLDHRTAFLLSRVDGTLSIEDILDVSGMARLETFRCLARLVLQGILEVR